MWNGTERYYRVQDLSLFVTKVGGYETWLKMLGFMHARSFWKVIKLVVGTIIAKYLL